MKIYRFLKRHFFCCFLLLISCNKSSNSTDVNMNNDAAAPSNLSVSATVRSDNTGFVDLVLSGTNVKSYDIDFGNGVIKNTSQSNYEYQYTESGTFTINVTAKNTKGSTSKSVNVTIAAKVTWVWSDEFDYTGSLDPTKWIYDIGNNNGWGNGESQYYTNRTANANVSNGTLKITAIKETYSGFNYTSARILTKGKFSKKYGKIEARMKLGTGVGTWPAFWMLGDNIDQIGWPACGEIDIMEMVGKSLNNITVAVHHPGRTGSQGFVGEKLIPTATSDFHVYAVVWNETTIRFLIDDVQFAQFANNASLPFNSNFFILLNIAMGGNYGGPIDSSFDRTTMEVDYVRVYN